MNIALMSHDNKKDLMVQFCTAYAGILSRHHIYATNTTGHMVAEATGLQVHCFLSYAHGGSQHGGRCGLYLPTVRPEQHSLCQQHRHGRGAGAGPGPGRSGLAPHRQPRFQPAHCLTFPGEFDTISLDFRADAAAVLHSSRPHREGRAR